MMITPQRSGPHDGASDLRRELSLSANAIAATTGMLAYIGINGLGVPAVPRSARRAHRIHTSSSNHTLVVSDPAKGCSPTTSTCSGPGAGDVAGLT